MWIMNEKRLIQVSDRIWYYPCQDDKDRPQLGYILGDRFSVAIDAGHSAEHVQEFYSQLEENGLPLPELTVITHWHWDHTFGMHAVHGRTVAGARTNKYLTDIHRRMETGEVSTATWQMMDPHIAMEYAGGQEMVVVPADLSFNGAMTIDAGGVHISLLETVSPHTNDSVLAYVQEEKALFVGDSPCGAYPNWDIDPDKMKQYLENIERIDFEWCFNGHWGEDSKEGFLKQLAEEMPEQSD